MISDAIQQLKQYLLYSNSLIFNMFLHIPLAPLKGGIAFRRTIMLVISILRSNLHNPV